LGAVVEVVVGAIVVVAVGLVEEGVVTVWEQPTPGEGGQFESSVPAGGTTVAVFTTLPVVPLATVPVTL
jgi:hypothetical protein